MSQRDSELTRQQERLINALLLYGSVKRAAEDVGISPVTAWRWQQKPEFVRQYREARRASVERAIAIAQAAGQRAVETIYEIMGDRSAPHFARLSAAQAVINLMLKGTELLDHETRINELEQSLGLAPMQDAPLVLSSTESL